MLLHALFNFERLGEPASLFVANKLAFFLKLLGESNCNAWVQSGQLRAYSVPSATRAL
ncbi:MAG: hypothetical protein IPL64_04365 [Flavobacteriales bacterium]|nr:hypothetical protein [Flavobacteriales bacterium]